MADYSKVHEQLSSMTQAASDIQRLALRIAITGRLSVDSRMDIIRHAEHIAALAKKLGKED